MNDEQHTEFRDDEEVQITDLDTPDSLRYKWAVRISNLTRKSLTTPWLYYALAGIMLLVLLGAFFQWAASIPPAPGSSTPYVLNATNAQGLIFIQNSNYTLAAYQATTERILWRTNLPTVATLKVARQTLYSYFFLAPAQTELEALDMKTGKVLWHDTLPATLTTTSNETSLAQSSPDFILSGNTVYIQDIDGLIYAIADSTGQIQWTHQADVNPAEQNVGFQVQNGMLAFLDLYFTVHILNASTGQEILHFPARYNVLPSIDGQMIYALPTPGESPIQVFHVPDGQLLWTYPLPADTSVVRESDGVVYLNAAAGATLLALRGNDGQRLWTYQTSDKQPAINVFFGTNDTIYLLQQDATVVSIRGSDGAVLWQTRMPELQNQVSALTTLLVDQGTIVLFNRFGSILAQPTTTYALRASNGQILWRSAQIVAYPWSLAGTLYAMQSNGQLDAWREDDGQHLWSYKAQTDTSIVEHLLPISNLLFLLSDTGTLYILRTSDGKLLWRYPL